MHDLSQSCLRDLTDVMYHKSCAVTATNTIGKTSLQLPRDNNSCPNIQGPAIILKQFDTTYITVSSEVNAMTTAEQQVQTPLPAQSGKHDQKVSKSRSSGRKAI